MDYQGALYYSYSDGVHGDELWKSDGTAAGTQLVADIRPGIVGSSPRNLTVVGHVPLLLGQRRASTAASSGRPTAPRPGTVDGQGPLRGRRVGSYPVAADQRRRHPLLHGLRARRAATSCVKSDGTAAGTVMVKDINPGAGSSTPRNLTAVGRHPVLHGNDGDQRDRAVEERRHGRRHRDGQGRLPGAGSGRPVGS